MLFQTTEFLILLLVSMAGIVVLRRARPQHWMLLIASYVFYGWWDVRFLTLILLSTVIDYAAALGMQGVRLSVGARARLSGMLIGASFLFLGVNWPAVQKQHLVPPLDDMFFPEWPGARAALIACVAFAVVGPGLYGFYFRLSERGAARRAFLITSVSIRSGYAGSSSNTTSSRRTCGNRRLDGRGSDAARACRGVAGGDFVLHLPDDVVHDRRVSGSIDAEPSARADGVVCVVFPQLVAGPNSAASGVVAGG
ncbi:MAG: hypothetical protein R3B46_09025 [Phycisphaerales bacterium]